MTEPIRIICQRAEDVPSADLIARSITDDQHLVLVFPASQSAAFDPQSIIERLTQELPDYSVFDSGGSTRDGSAWITVMRVVSRADVEAHATEIVAAARLFREQATNLMTRLAEKRSIALDAFATISVAERLFKKTGVVDVDWSYTFYWFECSLKNERTGQKLVVLLNFAGEFGAFDPGYFAMFVKSTPELDSLSRLFRNGYHDVLRALEILERRGDLKRMESPSTHRHGWIAALGCE